MTGERLLIRVMCIVVGTLAACALSSLAQAQDVVRANKTNRITSAWKINIAPDLDLRVTEKAPLGHYLKAEDFQIIPASAREADEGLLHYAVRRIDVSGPVDYSADTFLSQTKLVWIDFSVWMALNTVYGLKEWGWGKSKFHFLDEGFFGKDTAILGMDKLGHAYATMLYSDYFTQRIAHATDNRAGAALTGALLGLGVQTIVEVLDGFSPSYGFSKEDLIADGVGAGFSFLRNSVPGLADKIDYRMEYIKSPRSRFHPSGDYSGQKYVLALKLGGFEQFQDTPLRFVELQAGYFARGSLAVERNAGDELRREPYVAIGVNLSELLNGTAARNTTAGLAAKRALEYIQVPYTYVATVQN